MNGGNGISYQIFETYYTKAKEAESMGRYKEAKKMYFLAGETLLRSAKEVSGEMKSALVRRADKLIQIAETIQLEERPQAEESISNIGRTIKAKEVRSEEESETVWKSVGKPRVHFEDIAGLADVKESIRRRIILPRQHPDVYELFHRRVGGGILLYGPPGTGKTMIAEAIACEVDAEFFSIHCSDIVGKYFGEAEKNVKNLFETARTAKSAVLFFDEFEALGSQRGDNSSVMNRLVPELLSQMDGFSVSDRSNLLFLAATNRPWDIDSAFLRPPRLTEKIYVGLPDYEARLFLVNKEIEEVPHDPDVCAEEIAKLTEGYNAADVVSFCEVLKDGAIDRTIADGQKRNITRSDVEVTLKKIHSSVQKKDVEQIRKWEQTQFGQ